MSVLQDKVQGLGLGLGLSLDLAAAGQVAAGRRQQSGIQRLGLRSCSNWQEQICYCIFTPAAGAGKAQC
jgi:hypothetical protein